MIFIILKKIGFSITDPIIRNKLNQGQPISHHCLLCMSFGQPWQGENHLEPMCYRLVAGVIELLPEIEIIGQKMQRVGWGITQGRDYLQRQFSKQSPPLSKSTIGGREFSGLD